MATAPLDNLVRALTEPAALRDDAEGESEGRTLHGHFAVFNQWTEINSLWEGRFMERIAPGAFTRAFTEQRDRVKVLYEHGKDPSIGNKPLGTVVDLQEDGKGARYEVSLLDAPYVDEILPAARAGLLGASFRFRIVGEDRVEPQKPAKHNPERLMERTITDLDLYEFGPCPFPAYEAATAGVRSLSLTDDFMESLLRDPLFVARFTERVGLNIAEPIIAAVPPVERGDEQPAEVLALSEGTAGGQPEPKKYLTTPDALAQKRREIETFRMGVGKGY